MKKLPPKKQLCLASNNRAHADLIEYLQRKLRNAELRTAYDAEDRRIELALQIIRQRLEQNSARPYASR